MNVLRVLRNVSPKINKDISVKINEHYKWKYQGNDPP